MYFGLWFQRVKVHDGDSMVASGRHGGMTRKLRANFFNLKHEGEGVGKELEVT